MTVDDITRLIIAWDMGVVLYLALVFHMTFGSSHEKMKTRASLEDEGKFVILFLVVIATVTSLITIVMELTIVKDLVGLIKYQHIILVMLTLIVSWTFMQTVFAFHYAHDYYARISKGQQGGVIFP